MKPAEFDRFLAEGKSAPLILLYGEETFLLNRSLERLLDAVVPPAERDFNFQLFRGKEARAAAILDAVRTLPVFSPHRLVLIREADLLPATDLDLLLSYLAHPLAETVLVLVAEKIDARRKFWQEFRKHGQMVEFRPLYANQIPAFVREQARLAGRTMTEDAMALFCRRAGSSLQEVHGELVKLFSYLGETTIADVADVAAVVSDTRVDSIFDLTNAIGHKRTDEALRLLGRLLEDGVAPLLVLNMLTRHFRQLWMAHELLDQRLPAPEIARQIGANPYFLEATLAQAGRFPAHRYRQFFETFLQADLTLKSSAANPAVILEGVILVLGEGV